MGRFDFSREEASQQFSLAILVLRFVVVTYPTVKLMDIGLFQSQHVYRMVDQRCPASEVESISLLSGRAINISCSKDATITDAHHFWTTNGSFIESTSNNNNTLVISPKNPGLYICLSFSSDEVNILRAVNIIYDHMKPSQLPFEKCNLSFKDTSTNISATFGSNLSLSCEIGSLSAKIYWLKNNEIVSDKYGTYSKSYLNISNVQLIDEGNYTCVVHEKISPVFFNEKHDS
ncbi:coagulation factor X [Caerostris extrusa]|uniref:Coagulation factor X n=1 Tax=Caerostris extrusa TaxID=172846 RepID=A0AAV4MXM2_CAEEX|nr:coagulation factor X [Caerostris extrusa]